MIISNREISRTQPPYIVAEVSCNHGGDLNVLLETITAAKRCGCDAVKIQTYEAEDLTIPSSSPDFHIDKEDWGFDNLYDLYKASETPFEWHERIFAHAKKVGITLFSTPFSLRAVELLEKLDCPAYKIASMELNYDELLKAVGATKKPVILSTGLADMKAIHDAVDIVRDAAYGGEYEAGFRPQIAVLHCISQYPAGVSYSNIKRMDNIRYAIGDTNVDVGLSDHCLSNIPATLAVARGASIIEKHFTLSGVKSPDLPWSLYPPEMRLFVDTLHTAWEALGDGNIDQTKSPNKQFARSIYAVEDIKAGDFITPGSVAVIRPGYGLDPSQHQKLVKNGYAITDISVGDAITLYNIAFKT